MMGRFMLALAGFVLTTPLVAQEKGAAKVPPAVLSRAQATGSSRVIVHLRTGWRPEGDLAVPQQERQRAGIEAVQQDVATLLYGTGATLHWNFETIPFQVWEVTPAALAALASSPQVERVEEDALNFPSLAESSPLIQADQAWAAGYTGAGQMVAILDTGVDRTHSFLGGRVTAEACFSTTSSANGSTTLCPNGQGEQYGTGASTPCTGISGCDHGTHVAGIVGGSGASFSGVAKGTSIMGVQVFSSFSAAACGGSPCISSYNSDTLKALEYVYNQRNTYAIAAVNMSLGGSTKFTAYCDGDSRKAAVDNLRSAGIATVIASGNSGFIDGMSAPACISSAVSVGSTTKTDTVSSFSNSVSFLSLLAPGSSINSSVPGGGFAVKSGTSMATPQVAGAWAVLKQRKPAASVTQVLNAFQASGLPVTDTRNGVTKPRIRVKDAMGRLSPTPMDATGEGKADVMLRKSDGGVAMLTSTGTAFAGSPGGGTTLSNPAPITINDAAAASPYPSTISVPSFAGVVSKVTVTLTGFSHTWPSDVDVLLVGPGGQKAMLMSSVGGITSVSGLTLTLDDAGAAFGGSLTSGTFRPTNNFGANLPAPAPAGPYPAVLSAFNNVSPVGTWSLFVADHSGGDMGSISGGWSLSLNGGGGANWTTGFVPYRYDVSYEDVTGDGMADLVSRSRDTGNVEVFRSTGTTYTYAAGSGPGGVWSYGWGTTYDLYFADVTGDGKADLIGRSGASGDVYVAPSSGSGFGAPTLWSYGWSSGYDLYFADVTGDGKADLVSRYYGPTAGLTGDIYVGVSTGTAFTYNGRWTYGFSAGYNIYVGDMNGDGKADLLARYYGPTAGLTGDVYVIFSNGSAFSWNGNYNRWTYGWGSTYDIVVRDVNADGKADFVGRSSATGEVVVATSTGTTLPYQGTWATGVDTSWELR